MAPVTENHAPILRTATQIREGLQALRLLYRVELSAMVALSALAGYLFAGGNQPATVFLVTAGTALLAAGSSALNQWQERDLDQLMERTSRRPLPSGILTPPAAMLLAALTITSGVLLLTALPDPRSLLLGMLAMVWYNAIYTPLKRRTPFAAIPGAICGALPPLLGWAAAGAPLGSQQALILAGTLFIWQIPHTWLLLCRYRADLQRSGLPDLFQRIPTEQLVRINNCWIGALFLAYLLFPTFQYIASPSLTIIYILGLVALFLSVLRGSFGSDPIKRAAFQFHRINASMALLLSTLILDRLLMSL